jgi:hypothetical protein
MTQTASIQINKDLHVELKKHCKDKGLKLQWLVETLIKDKLNDTEEKNTGS